MALRSARKNSVIGLAAACFIAVGSMTSCAPMDAPHHTASPKDIAVSRTYQKRSVKMAQSDFVFMASVEVVKKLGFVIEKEDREAMTLQAFRVHNNTRILFRVAVMNQGRETLIKMDTQYYDRSAFDYNEPYASYSRMMWDYLGQKLNTVY